MLLAIRHCRRLSALDNSPQQSRERMQIADTCYDFTPWTSGSMACVGESSPSEQAAFDQIVAGREVNGVSVVLSMITAKADREAAHMQRRWSRAQEACAQGQGRAGLAEQRRGRGAQRQRGAGLPAGGRRSACAGAQPHGAAGRCADLPTRPPPGRPLSAPLAASAWACISGTSKTASS